MMKKVLEKHYWDVSQPGSLSGSENFFRALKNKKVKVDKQEVHQWLMGQEAYTLHKQVRRRYKRNRVYARGIDDLWQIDLADLQIISKSNDNHRYLLTCIDVFSKYAFVVPVKNKTSEVVLNAFKNIISSSGRKPNNVQSDQGTEFVNLQFKKYLNEIDTGFYQVNSELKASVVERFNRTIKEKIYRYLTLKNTNRYIDVLNDLILSYNNSYHRSIKTSPASVNDDNQKQIYKILYKDKKNNYNFNLSIGDLVRISKNKRIFEKGYTAGWTEEVFIVTHQIPRDPPVYRLKDLNNEDLEGVFYDYELQKITLEKEVFIIDKILKKKKEKGVYKYFVSWRGYPTSFNSWITENDIDKEYLKK